MDAVSSKASEALLQGTEAAVGSSRARAGVLGDSPARKADP